MRGNLGTLKSQAGQRKACLRARRHLRPRRDGRAASPNTSPARCCTLPRKATSTARFTGPADFVQTNVVGTFTLLEAARLLEHVGRRGEGSVPLPARLDRRSLRLAVRHRSAILRNHAVRAQQPLFGDQGGLGSSGARVSSHVWPAGAHHELLEQLRPVPVSREADSADDRQRARGKPLPVYGDGQNVRDWLYVGDHCSAIREVLRARHAGRDVQRRRLEREEEPRGGAHAVRSARPAAIRRRPARTATRSPT